MELRARRHSIGVGVCFAVPGPVGGLVAFSAVPEGSWRGS